MVINCDICLLNYLHKWFRNWFIAFRFVIEILPIKIEFPLSRSLFLWLLMMLLVAQFIYYRCCSFLNPPDSDLWFGFRSNRHLWPDRFQLSHSPSAGYIWPGSAGRWALYVCGCLLACWSIFHRWCDNYNNHGKLLSNRFANIINLARATIHVADGEPF